MEPAQPYRPAPDGELERLAVQGQQAARVQRLQSQKDEEPEIEARLLSAMELLPAPPRSLGAFLGTWIPRACFGLGGLLLALSLVPDDKTLSGNLCLLGVGALSVATAWVLLPLVLSSRLARNGVMHKARDKAVLAVERAWPSSLPFALEGYFEILGQEPRLGQIEAAIALRTDSQAPDLDVLRGVVLGADVDAEVSIDSSGTITILSGFKSCYPGGVNEVSNREIPPYVHALVEKALLPLHRSHPIERVSLARA
jgi:hypothetical protein